MAHYFGQRCILYNWRGNALFLFYPKEHPAVHDEEARSYDPVAHAQAPVTSSEQQACTSSVLLVEDELPGAGTSSYRLSQTQDERPLWRYVRDNRSLSRSRVVLGRIPEVVAHFDVLPLGVDAVSVVRRWSRHPDLLSEDSLSPTLECPSYRGKSSLYKQGVEEFASRRMFFKTSNTRVLLRTVFVHQERIPIARCG